MCGITPKKLKNFWGETQKAGEEARDLVRVLRVRPPCGGWEAGFLLVPAPRAETTVYV